MKHVASEPAELNRLLADYLVAAGLANPLGREQLHRVWCQVAGEEIGRHTRLAAPKRGVLTVEVDSPGLLLELSSFARDQLLAGLQGTDAGRSIRALRFRLGVFD